MNDRFNPGAHRPKGNWHTVQPTPPSQPSLVPLTDFRGPQSADFDAVLATLKSATGQTHRIPVIMRHGEVSSQRGVAIESDDSDIIRIARFRSFSAARTPQPGEHDVVALVHRAPDGNLYAEFAN